MANLKPIVLTEFGEAVQPSPRFQGEVLEETTVMGYCLGNHIFCGALDLNQVSKTHRALSCRKCALRVMLPITVTTFAELREHFKAFQVEEVEEAPPLENNRFTRMDAE